ncbi:hypothetical protein CXG81DRAFT_27995 [Caulochytrium protostelioides]|uniref:MINDY deubiquitinase domain-containing protein n=1 Tax=Caulochytrium protostelioides TaxID=1555241 RepID=A0A4P9X044_9FUNG|nr:hypothetical protein CXG81DRAFT_27995 [Caulochytrium protostelioides]|eukprot:RKO99229.1 hypothetical protein CXG81DRAFT_27995 [Caulochytrium protostelioides]
MADAADAALASAAPPVHASATAAAAPPTMVSSVGAVPPPRACPDDLSETVPLTATVDSSVPVSAADVAPVSAPAAAAEAPEAVAPLPTLTDASADVNADVDIDAAADADAAGVDADAVYATKTIAYQPPTFLDPDAAVGTYRIVLQNANGPCPLIALSNVLILRGEIRLTGPTVAAPELIRQIARCVLDRAPLAAADAVATDTTVATDAVAPRPSVLTRADLLRILPPLRNGMDVNLYFDSPFHFASTPSLDLFRQLDIALVHGWLADPETDAAAHAVLAQDWRHYDHAMEQICLAMDANEALAAATAATVVAATAPRHDADRDRLIHQALVAQDFFDTHASQLTPYGIRRLTHEVSPGTFSVLFRNAHFAVLHVRHGALYTLVTDQGVAEDGRAVWQTLADVSDDGDFVDAHFMPPPAAAPPAPAAAAAAAAADADAGGSATYAELVREQQRQQTAASPGDADLAYALSLQDELNAQDTRHAGAGAPAGGRPAPRAGPLPAGRPRPAGPAAGGRASGSNADLRSSKSKKAGCAVM